MRIININNNNNNNIRNSQKVFKEILIHICIIIPLLTIFYYNNQKNSKITPQKSKSFPNIIISNKTNDKINFRYLTTILQGAYNKEEAFKKIQHKDIIDKLTKKKYYGRWFTDTTNSTDKKLVIGESFTGLTELQFIKAYQVISKEDAIIISIKNYEGNYINHWLEHSSYILLKYLQFIPDKINNNFIIKGNLETELEYGELFDTKITRRFPCRSNFTFVFPLKNVSYSIKILDGDNYNIEFSSIDEKNFKSKIESYCGFNMSLEMSSEEENNKYYYKKEEKKEVFKYLILVLIVCILTFISDNIIFKNLNDNKDTAKCLPLFNICFNINWHFYCCLTHLRWSLDYKEYYYEFNSIGLIYTIMIIFYDFKLSCFFWSLIPSYNRNRIYIQKRMLYYSSFYIFFTITLFFRFDFFASNIWIKIILFLTWTPQIIYNMIYNNKYIYPILNLISSSLDKLIFGIYFRGYNSNFFRIKGDLNVIIIIMTYLLFCFVILYLQYKKGPRFFLGKKCQKEEINFYKTKKELINLIKDVDKMECVICLMPIFYDDNKDKNTNNINNNEINNEQINIDNNKSINSDINIIDQTNMNNLNNTNENNNNNKLNILNQNKIRKKPKFKFNKTKFKNSIINFFEAFYKFRKISADANKPYMTTPCNHVFHRDCLEKWLYLKKECPNCRYDLSNII